MNVKVFLPGKSEMLVAEFEIKEDFSYETIFDLSDTYVHFINDALSGSLSVDFIDPETFEKKTKHFENRTGDLIGFCNGLKKFIELLGPKIEIKE